MMTAAPSKIHVSIRTAKGRLALCKREKHTQPPRMVTAATFSLDRPATERLDWKPSAPAIYKAVRHNDHLACIL
eukprot:1156138-Pelagomonas_calceolata.AAC.19